MVENGECAEANSVRTWTVAACLKQVGKKIGYIVHRSSPRTLMTVQPYSHVPEWDTCDAVSL